MAEESAAPVEVPCFTVTYVPLREGRRWRLRYFASPKTVITHWCLDEADLLRVIMQQLPALKLDCEKSEARCPRRST